METTLHKQIYRASLLIFGIMVLSILMNTNGETDSAAFNVQEVGVEQAKHLVDAGAVVIDVRGEEQFAFRHIPGAIYISLAVLRQGIPASFAIARDARIIVYCNMGLLHGEEATHLLQQAGYKKAVNLKPGIEGWVEAGLPVEKG